MITNEEGDDVEDEITAKVFLLAMKLKRNKTTKADQTVELYFCLENVLKFSFNINTSQTVDQLIKQIQAYREVIFNFYDCY